MEIPARPKMDDNDPSEVYDIARMPRKYNEAIGTLLTSIIRKL